MAPVFVNGYGQCIGSCLWKPDISTIPACAWDYHSPQWFSPKQGNKVISHFFSCCGNLPLKLIVLLGIISIKLLFHSGISFHFWFEDFHRWQYLKHYLKKPLLDSDILSNILTLSYLGNIIRKHNIYFHCYAHDSQLYLFMKPHDTNQLVKLQACLKNKKACMTSHCLLQTKLRLLYSALIFTLDGITLASSYTVRNLGVTFTSTYISFCVHIKQI